MDSKTEKMIDDYVPRVITKPAMRLVIKAALVESRLELSTEQKAILTASMMRQFNMASGVLTPVDMVPKSDFLLLDAKYRTATNLLEMYGDRDKLAAAKGAKGE